MTHSKLKKLPAALLVALGKGAVASLIIAPVAFAQQAAPATQKVEKIEVTGSNIKRVDAETTAPIQIIDKEEITRSGKTTVTELLRTLPISATGGLNDITGSNSFSSGASTVSLRGLGSTATLVLLNGRRVAPFGPADPNFGQSAVVNLDSLPLDVVERIEILKDGASAIYGSEAIAGVVNIILRKDYTGAQIGGSFSLNRDSEYRISRASTTLGYGDLGRDKYNVFVNYERYQRESTNLDAVANFLLRQEATASAYAVGRHFASSYAGNYLNGVVDPLTGIATATSFKPAAQQPANCDPGAIKDAGGICRWDNIPRTEVVPKSNRDNFFARGTIDFTPNLTGFAEVGYNRTVTYYKGNPQVYGDFGAWFSSTQNKLVNLPETLPVRHPNNPFATPVIFRHRFVEVGNTDGQVKAEATRLLGGFKGVLGNWDLESAILYSENKAESTNFNQIRYSVLSRGVTQGTYNFINPSAGAIKPDDLRINTVDNAKSSFTIYDLKGSSEIVQLPAGPLAVAAGIEYRNEKRKADPDAAKVAGEVIGFGSARVDGSRNVSSFYAELSVPILKNLESQWAVRTDKYSDYGRSTTPKLGLKWKALQTLAFRGSYAKGFRAPSLTEISPSSVTAFTAITDPKRCITGNEPDCSRTVAALSQNAKTLDPETAKTYSGGFIWDPMKDVSMTLDYFDIRRKHEITRSGNTELLANEDAPPTSIYYNRVIRGPAAGDGLPGPVQALRRFYFNGGATLVKGFDFDGIWNVNIGEYGKLINRASATYYKSWKGSSTDDGPLTEFVAYRLPRVRATIGTTWVYQDFSTGLTFNHVHGYHTKSTPTANCAGATYGTSAAFPTPFCEVRSMNWADAVFQYRGFKNLDLTLTVRNVTDKHPPLDILALPANFTYHPYQGMYATLGGVYRFK